MFWPPPIDWTWRPKPEMPWTWRIWALFGVLALLAIVTNGYAWFWSEDSFQRQMKDRFIVREWGTVRIPCMPGRWWGHQVNFNYANLPDGPIHNTNACWDWKNMHWVVNGYPDPND